MNSTSPNLETALPGLADFPVIGIVRRLPPDVVPEVARAAFDAGLRYLEVTMDSDDALAVISKLRRHHRGIGVGSVTRVGQVARAAEAGAEFVVSPITHTTIIQATVEAGLAAFPGAATPTEIDLALSSGATAVKVFPAEQLGGPGYIKAITAPLGNPHLIPTGGVTTANAAEYIRAGASAVGAGTALFSAKAIAEEGVDSVSRRIAEWREALA